MYRLDSKSLATLYLWYTGFLPGWSGLGRTQEYITFCSGLTAHEPVQTCLEKERRGAKSLLFLLYTLDMDLGITSIAVPHAQVYEVLGIVFGETFLPYCGNSNDRSKIYLHPVSHLLLWPQT